MQSLLYSITFVLTYDFRLGPGVVGPEVEAVDGELLLLLVPQDQLRPVSSQFSCLSTL